MSSEKERGMSLRVMSQHVTRVSVSFFIKKVFRFDHDMSRNMQAMLPHGFISCAQVDQTCCCQLQCAMWHLVSFDVGHVSL